ncbi:MAG: hypothetical protein ACXVHJ_37715, partial [Solirubrobacteraceae bacterium]
CSSPPDAGEAAALVLAAQEFVANGGRPWSAQQCAASSGRTGSRGNVGSAWLVARLSEIS